MSTELNIGKRLNHGEHQRDAIHIAVAPVVAGETLNPGERIGFLPNGKVGKGAEDVVGIVDPYLDYSVYENEQFWLFLFPNTVTSLKHFWSHPAFPDEKKISVTSIRDSRKWINDFATELNQTPDKLMEAAKFWVTNNDFTYDNSENYKEVEYSKWKLFWHHYEVVTKTKLHPSVEKRSFFTCSC